MDSTRWDRAESIYHAALERAPGERAAYVNDACGGDEALRRDVESLLAFLELPVMAVAADVATSAVVAPASLVGQWIGVFHVVGRLGVGGMGEVYRARDTKLGREVAIKRLPAAFAADRERLSRFEREARVLAALNHPHIGGIYGLETHEGAPVLVLELVPGETLAARLVRGPLPVATALAYALQLADALDAAHEKAIVHRDLKPANIAITPDGVVKVLDFGLAKAGGPDSGEASQAPTVTIGGTREGLILGTAAYMSPEQARGLAVDKRTDIWAFGCVLYEMLTGRAAFARETISDTIAAVLECEPDWTVLPEPTPPGVRRLLQHCLDKDAKRRLHDIADARIHVDDGVLASSKRSAPPFVAKKPMHQWSWWVAIAVAATGALFFLRGIWRPSSVPSGAPQSALRTLVHPPPDATLGDTGAAAISKDGHFLAFLATSQGQTRVWIRPVASLAARPLAGTEGALYPFWSPDSRYVGFFANGKLLKIDAFGGPVQPICDAPNGRGASWNAKGTIVFTPSIGGVLHRVAASGGSPTAITQLDHSRDEDAHYWPNFLPDGRHVLYFARSRKAENNGIYVVDAEAGVMAAAERLVDSNSMGVYAPPGYLLFLSGGSLVAQRFDDRQFRVTGNVLPVAENVGSQGSIGRGFFSVSTTGLLVYRSPESSERQLTWVDRHGKALESVGPLDTYRSFRLSPKGDRVAAEIIDTRSGTTGIWLLDLVRGTKSRFVVEARQNGAPVWSPSEDWIAFRSDRTAPFNLYRKSTNTVASEERLTTESRAQIPLDWSRDGRFLLYRQNQDADRYDIWVLPIADYPGKPLPVVTSPFNEAEAQFSPDGKYFAYASDESHRMDVYLQTFPAARKWPVSNLGGSQPRWRGDGRELFYVGPDARLMAVSIRVSASDLSLETPQPLFEHRALGALVSYGYDYDVTSDGQRFLLAVPARASDSQQTITVVTNWTATLPK